MRTRYQDNKAQRMQTELTTEIAEVGTLLSVYRPIDASTRMITFTFQGGSSPGAFRPEGLFNIMESAPMKFFCAANSDILEGDLITLNLMQYRVNYVYTPILYQTPIAMTCYAERMGLEL